MKIMEVRRLNWMPCASRRSALDKPDANHFSAAATGSQEYDNMLIYVKWHVLAVKKVLTVPFF